MQKDSLVLPFLVFFFVGKKAREENLPKDPPVLKILRRVNFGMGRKFGTDAAKRYGEGSEMLNCFSRQKRQENGTESKNYGASKILRFERRTIFSTEGSFGLVSHYIAIGNTISCNAQINKGLVATIRVTGVSL